MNLKRIAVVALGIWAAAFGLHYWLNSERSTAGKKESGGVRRQFTVAYIPVT
jgi:hypothetical protein